ncbi:MAG: hypothetical protein QNI87_05480 [Erythrobacter sp.]|uniref:hypothetical protein n=1 Tax=Erythrobacter sp. TaxID=1042 RepID=UPI002623F8F1|nr:hypothetical protein [Erythrobacter sp.]MDJ0977969.1 hypothetical protein [Erythrobacter sp.]
MVAVALAVMIAALGHFGLVKLVCRFLKVTWLRYLTSVAAALLVSPSLYGIAATGLASVLYDLESPGLGGAFSFIFFVTLVLLVPAFVGASVIIVAEENRALFNRE